MGTPSYIAKQIGADSYLTIYCQIEGHLHSTGYLLDKHYNTPEQVRCTAGIRRYLFR